MQYYGNIFILDKYWNCILEKLGIYFLSTICNALDVYFVIYHRTNLEMTKIVFQNVFDYHWEIDMGYITTLSHRSDKETNVI